MAVIALFLISAIITGIGVQLYHGYYKFELLLYVKSLFLFHFITFSLLAVLGIFIQTIVNNKFTGYMFMVLYFIGLIVLPGIGLEDNLFYYTDDLHSTYSDMNGFGHNAQRIAWFSFYRLFFAFLLCVISILFWIRGTETSFKLRMKLVQHRFNKSIMITTGFAVIMFFLTGSFIFYNTHILNKYKSTEIKDTEAAAYEKKYKKYENSPQPRITDVFINMDIFTEQKNLDIRGRYILKNKTTFVWVMTPPQM